MVSAKTAVLPSPEEVMAWLSEVPDPEIPVISITELGIVRKVGHDGDTLVVTVTPTYSGCPAVSLINLEIEAKLLEKGVTDFRLEQQLSRPGPRIFCRRKRGKSFVNTASPRRLTARLPMAGLLPALPVFPAAQISSLPVRAAVRAIRKRYPSSARPPARRPIAARTVLSRSIISSVSEEE